MGKYLTSIWMCFIVLGIILTVRIIDPKPVEQTRLMAFDYAISTLEKSHSEQIALIDIGEKSLEKYGQWPWPRQYYAQMISDLRDAGAGVIGFTIMYPEVDRFGGDEVFVSWVKDNGIVLAQTPSSKGRSDVAPYVGTAILGTGDPYNYAYAYAGIVTNIPELEQGAAGIGMVNSTLEIDNLVRRMPLITQVNNQLYPSFPMEIIRVLQEKKSYSMHVENSGIIDLMIPPYDPIKTDYSGSIWINWSNQFSRTEYSDPLLDLQGKTVIVGVSAEGIQPLLSTPQGAALPHQIQASALQTIMNGDSITRPAWASLAEIVLALLVGVGIILVVYQLPLWLSGFGFLTFAGAGGIVAYYLFVESAFLIDWTYSLLLSIIVFAQASFNNFYKQFKLRQQIKKQFGTYLSPDMVAMLQKDPSLLKLGGERKEMTFLFMDIVGFTPISEHYKKNDDPEGLVDLINMFLDKMTNILLDHGATIDKYMGDCIMAFWNAPLPCEDHADRAVNAALEIEEASEEINERIKELGLPSIDIGIGINTGICIVGNMGSKKRFDYSVIGDAVNLASRLEGATRNYDARTLLSRDTWKQLRDATPILLSEVDRIRVKGKSEEITIYTPTRL